MTLADRIIARFSSEFPRATEAGLARLRVIITEEAKAASKERKRAGIHEGAESIYALYPRREGGTAALQAISKAIEKHGYDLVASKTKSYGEAVKAWPRLYRWSQPKDGIPSRDLVPMAITWFNQERFLDDASNWVRVGGKPAPEIHVCPPEPEGWKEAFPDFTDRDKPWRFLQPAQQNFIINAMSATQSMTATPKEVQAEQHLRLA